eukprot:gene8781-18159_t
MIHISNIPLLKSVPFVLLYYVAYKLVDRFPNLLHNRRTIDKAQIKVIGHRGSRNEGLPENSIAAFKDAVSVGVDMVELDVWLTTDNKVIVFHDKSTERMTGGEQNVLVSTVSYDELPKIKPQTGQRERCSLFLEVDWNRIPLLEEVLDCVPPSTYINIEFKQNSDLLISEVIRILSERNRIGSVFWFSLMDAINTKLRKAEPRIPTVVSVQGMLSVLLLYYCGLLPFVPLPDAVFGITVQEITLEQVRREQALAGLPDWIHRSMAYIFRGRPPLVMVAPKLFAHLRRRGMGVWFLGVDSDEDLQLASRTGATAVLCDRIRWVKQSIGSGRVKLLS